MNNKEIEEIAIELIHGVGNWLNLGQAICVVNLLLASGWIKPNEDSVVLAREEFETLKLELAIEKKRADESYTQKEVEEIIASKERTKSKETARGVLDKVYDFGQGFFIERSFMEEDEFNGILDEVKKLFLDVVEK